MDTLTHALSGALLARATASKDASPHSLPRRIAAGFFACAAPDLDFVLSYVGPVEYLLHHRGVTHSIILLPLWALGLSWVLAKVLREPRGWRTLYGVTALAVAAHIVGDLITSFGTIIFAPFSNWRAAIGTTFIIDLWFSGIVVAGLLLSVAFWRSRWPAITASAVLVAYVGFQYVQKQNAIDFGEQYARTKPA
jgi:inner membrane protein